MLRQTFQIATGSRMCSGLAAAKSMRSRAVFLLLAAVVIAVVDAGFQIPMSLLWFCCRWPSFCIPVVLATCNPDCCVLLATSRCPSRLPSCLPSISLPVHFPFPRSPFPSVPCAVRIRILFRTPAPIHSPFLLVPCSLRPSLHEPKAQRVFGSEEYIATSSCSSIARKGSAAASLITQNYVGVMHLCKCRERARWARAEARRQGT